MEISPYTGDPRLFVSCCQCGKQSTWISHDGTYFLNTYCDDHKPLEPCS